MAEICIPMPSLDKEELVEVEVKLKGRKLKFNFRVESFDWDEGKGAIVEQPELSETEKRIIGLRKMIDTYDKDWELVQIFAAGIREKTIQVMFRQRLSA